MGAITHAIFALGAGTMSASFVFHAHAQSASWGAAHAVMAALWAGLSLASATEACAAPAGSARLAPIVRICATIAVAFWFIEIAHMLGRTDVWDEPVAGHAVPVIGALCVLAVPAIWLVAIVCIASCCAHSAAFRPCIKFCLELGARDALDQCTKTTSAAAALRAKVKPASRADDEAMPLRHGSSLIE